MSRLASGFPCPKCKSEELADVVSIKLPQIVLICRKCSTEFAVEL